MTPTVPIIVPTIGGGVTVIQVQGRTVRHVVTYPARGMHIRAEWQRGVYAEPGRVHIFGNPSRK